MPQVTGNRCASSPGNSNSSNSNSSSRGRSPRRTRACRSPIFAGWCKTGTRRPRPRSTSVATEGHRHRPRVRISSTRGARSAALTVAFARRLSPAPGPCRDIWRTRIFTCRSRSAATSAAGVTSRGTVWSATRASITRRKSGRSTRNSARRSIGRHRWSSLGCEQEVPPCPARGDPSEGRRRNERRGLAEKATKGQSF